jgi:hypothetical protein
MAPTAHHDTATKTDPPLRFIFEMVRHPTRVEIKDPHSGEVLAELDQATSEALLSEGGRPGPDSAAEQDVATLQQEHQDLAAECEAMERFIVEALSNDCEDCDELTCANHPDLGGRRILCVGGRARLIDQYRDRVTRCN